MHTEVKMAYRVLVGKVAIECDTVEEALEIANHAGGLPIEGASTVTPVHPQKGNESAGSRWTKARLEQFLKLVHGAQQKILDELMQFEEGRTDRQLLQLIGMDEGRALAGVLSGLAKNAKKSGVGSDELYQKNLISMGDEKLNEYRLTDSFRAAMKQWKH